MGFWQGVNEAITYSLDRKAQRESDAEARAWDREKFERTLLENRKIEALKRADENEKRRQELQAQVTLGVNLGLSEESTVALLRTGQLGLFLDQYDKNKKVDPLYVKELDATVQKMLKDSGEDAMSRALLGGVSTGRDVSNDQESYMAITESIMGATDEASLEAASIPLYNPVGPAPMKTLPIDFGYASGPESTETNAIAKEIATRLQGNLKDSYTITTDGQIAITKNADPKVAELLNTAADQARLLAYGPTRSMSPTDAAAFVSNNIQTAIVGTQGRANAASILENFEGVMSNPQEFVTNFAPPPPTVPVDVPTSTIESGADNLSESYTGFDSLVDEETRGSY